MKRLLERHGWSVVRRGKHPIYGKPGAAGNVAVPDHGRKTLALGTQKSILRAAGLTEADL
jgi:predicted RNA binding protein YcfA (HicA-like mRNA interferase family)